jgi:hypothetical protein
VIPRGPAAHTGRPLERPLLALVGSKSSPDGGERLLSASHGLRTDAAAWPLTVPSGVVHCSGSAATLTARSATYAVNGIALGRLTSLPKMNRIRKKIPKGSILGPRVDISPIIDRGLKLCGQ